MFNFDQPITTYEFIAIVLSVIALLIPEGKWIYDKLIKRLRFDFIPSGMITLYHNKSGSYISLGGVYESKNKSTTVKDIAATVIRKSDNATLPLTWSTFPSPVYRNIAGNYETSFETAHPFKVEADTLVPAFIEFSKTATNTDEETNKILTPVVRASSVILAQPNIGVAIADAQVKQLKEYNNAKLELNDLFFWKKSKYDLVIATKHGNSTLKKVYTFELTNDDSNKLKENIDNLLVIHVADHYRMTVTMNSIRKEFKEPKA